MNPIIFEEYNFHKAENAFPLVQTRSTPKEVDDAAWLYTIDLLRHDPVTLSDVVVGEYFETVELMDKYHQDILQAIAESDYEKIGRLVEESFHTFNQKTLDYIDEHITQMRYRYE